MLWSRFNCRDYSGLLNSSFFLTDFSLTDSRSLSISANAHSNCHMDGTEGSTMDSVYEDLTKYTDSITLLTRDEELSEHIEENL